MILSVGVTYCVKLFLVRCLFTFSIVIVIVFSLFFIVFSIVFSIFPLLLYWVSQISTVAVLDRKLVSSVFTHIGSTIFIRILPVSLFIISIIIIFDAALFL